MIWNNAINRDTIVRDRARRAPRDGSKSPRVFAVLVALLALLAATPSTAQEMEQSRAERVGELVGGIRVQGKPYVATSSSYDPDARIIHEPDVEIDYPVELSTAEWKERLTPHEFYVLRQDGTERAFQNPLYDTKERGIYYSAATGQPLFHSDDKYESGTGWPSFTKPISPDAVAYFWDRGLFSRRVEVADSLSGSHIGHVFEDGPAPYGQRYCMNSAALIFVPEGGNPPEMLTGSVGRQARR